MIRFLKIFFGTVFTLLILIGSCVFYAFKIEPYRIASNQLYLNEKTSDFIKVVQFSDTHIKADFNYKNLDKVVNYINKQNPDVVVFTVIIPGLSEPPVRTLRATCPENESHIFR